jgi:hypothetical protein
MAGAASIFSEREGGTMTTAETVMDEEVAGWSIEAEHVQKVLAFIRKRGARGVTAEELVEWDARHGKRLFQWDDRAAAAAWRVHQARLFLNSFRGVFDRMRVRKFIHVPGGEATGHAEGGAYLDSAVISADEKLRAWAIGDLTGRLARLASELKFWRLTEAERAAVFARMEMELTGEPV